MRGRDGIYGRTGLRPIIGEAEQFADLIEREAEIACAPNEREPCQMLFAIAAIVGGVTCRGRQQPDLS